MKSKLMLFVVLFLASHVRGYSVNAQSTPLHGQLKSHDQMMTEMGGSSSSDAEKKNQEERQKRTAAQPADTQESPASLETYTAAPAAVSQFSTEPTRPVVTASEGDVNELAAKFRKQREAREKARKEAAAKH